jgi:hypothetical protein
LELFVAAAFLECLTLCSKFFAEFAFEDLARGVAWQVFHEEDVLGAFE